MDDQDVLDEYTEPFADAPQDGLETHPHMSSSGSSSSSEDDSDGASLHSASSTVVHNTESLGVVLPPDDTSSSELEDAEGDSLENDSSTTSPDFGTRTHQGDQGRPRHHPSRPFVTPTLAVGFCDVSGHEAHTRRVRLRLNVWANRRRREQQELTASKVPSAQPSSAGLEREPQFAVVGLGYDDTPRQLVVSGAIRGQRVSLQVEDTNAHTRFLLSGDYDAAHGVVRGQSSSITSRMGVGVFLLSLVGAAENTAAIANPVDLGWGTRFYADEDGIDEASVEILAELCRLHDLPHVSERLLAWAVSAESKRRSKGKRRRFRRKSRTTTKATTSATSARAEAPQLSRTSSSQSTPTRHGTDRANSTSSESCIIRSLIGLRADELHSELHLHSVSDSILLLGVINWLLQLRVHYRGRSSHKGLRRGNVPLNDLPFCALASVSRVMDLTLREAFDYLSQNGSRASQRIGSVIPRIWSLRTPATLESISKLDTLSRRVRSNFELPDSAGQRLIFVKDMLHLPPSTLANMGLREAAAELFDFSEEYVVYLQNRFHFLQKKFVLSDVIRGGSLADIHLVASNASTSDIRHFLRQAGPSLDESFQRVLLSQAKMSVLPASSTSDGPSSSMVGNTSRSISDQPRSRGRSTTSVLTFDSADPWHGASINASASEPLLGSTNNIMGLNGGRFRVPKPWPSVRLLSAAIFLLSIYILAAAVVFKVMDASTNMDETWGMHGSGSLQSRSNMFSLYISPALAIATVLVYLFTLFSFMAVRTLISRSWRHSLIPRFVATVFLGVVALYSFLWALVPCTEVTGSSCILMRTHTTVFCVRTISMLLLGLLLSILPKKVNPPWNVGRIHAAILTFAIASQVDMSIYFTSFLNIRPFTSAIKGPTWMLPMVVAWILDLSCIMWPIAVKMFVWDGVPADTDPHILAELGWHKADGSYKGSLMSWCSCLARPAAIARLTSTKLKTVLANAPRVCEDVAERIAPDTLSGLSETAQPILLTDRRAYVAARVGTQPATAALFLSSADDIAGGDVDPADLFLNASFSSLSASPSTPVAVSSVPQKRQLIAPFAARRALTDALQALRSAALEPTSTGSDDGSASAGTRAHGYGAIASDAARAQSSSQPLTVRPSGRSTTHGDLNDIPLEVRLLASIQHSNIVSMLGWVQTPTVTAVILEPLLGTLSQKLESDAIISEKDKISFMIDAASGLTHLHSTSPRVVHRNVNPGCLFFDSFGTLKVGDLSHARWMSVSTIPASTGSLLPANHPQRPPTPRAGRFPRMAPEMMTAATAYDHKVDQFSFGLCMWQTWTRRMPFQGIGTLAETEAAVCEGVRPRISSSCPNVYASLMRACWTAEPSRRPEFTEVTDTLRRLLVQYKSGSDSSSRL